MNLKPIASNLLWVAGQTSSKTTARDQRGFEDAVGIELALTRAGLPTVCVCAGRQLASKPSALLAALHGCYRTHEEIQQIAGFDALADSEQFLVLYPFVTSYQGLRCTRLLGWWIKAHRKRGRGEVGGKSAVKRDGGKWRRGRLRISNCRLCLDFETRTHNGSHEGGKAKW